MAMVVDKDARNLAAIKVQRVVLPTVRLTEEVRGANTLVVLRAQKVKQTTALLMVVGGVVSIQKDAIKLPVGSQAFALSMEGVRDVRSKAALGALRAKLVCASPMEVDVAANSRIVPRVLKVALCTVRHTEVGNAAYLQGAQKVLRVALLSARPTAAESVVCMMVGVYARRVCMEGPTTVLLMVVENVVLFQDAARVHVDALHAVSSTEEVSAAKLKIVERAHKVALTFAKLTEVASDAVGERENVKSLPEEGAAYVLLTAA